MPLTHISLSSPQNFFWVVFPLSPFIWLLLIINVPNTPTHCLFFPNLSSLLPGFSTTKLPVIKARTLESALTLLHPISHQVLSFSPLKDFLDPSTSPHPHCHSSAIAILSLSLCFFPKCKIALLLFMVNHSSVSELPTGNPDSYPLQVNSWGLLLGFCDPATLTLQFPKFTNFMD